tara:strand:- start:1367 stop:1780 length:414 start_codon:yes stop_codon:yes gene_type:complete
MKLRYLENYLVNFLNKFSTLSQLLLRFGLGIAFIIHGFNKFPLPPESLMTYFDFGPLLSSFIAISEIFSGFFLIIAGFIRNYIGNILTRFSALVIIIIMICAFYIAHKDWFINSKLFTSEQFFLLLVGFYFFINGNK